MSVLAMPAHQTTSLYPVRKTAYPDTQLRDLVIQKTLLPQDTSHDDYNMSAKATMLRCLPIVDTLLSGKVSQEGEALVT
jgi:hypothetical protein